MLRVASDVGGTFTDLVYFEIDEKTGKALNIKTIEHEQLNPRNQTSHTVLIQPKTLLHNIIGKNKIEVNSAHHQAIDSIGNGLIISSKSKDNIIESIESTKHKWCIGIQWHPEFLITKTDKLIISDFIKNAQKK